MDEWKKEDGRMDECTNGRMDNGRMDEWTEWMSGRMDNGQTDEWTNGQTNGLFPNSWCNGCDFSLDLMRLEFDNFIDCCLMDRLALAVGIFHGVFILNYCEPFSHSCGHPYY